MAKIKKYIDNKSMWYGETIPGVMRVNLKKSASTPFTKKSPVGIAGQADTIVHEQMHADHPKMHEWTVRRKTKVRMEKMPESQKKKIVTNFKKSAVKVTERVRRQFYKAAKSSAK